MEIPENLYACSVCEESFPIAKSLVDHVNRYHVPVLSRIEHKKETKIVKSSPVSNKQDKKSDKVDTTNLQKEEKETKIVKSTPFPNEQQKKDKGKLSCEYCSKTFTLKSSLRNHEKLHSGGKSFPCTYCDRKFARKKDVESHERIHTGEKPFSCSYCDKSFNRKDMLVLHTKRHTEEKPQCKYCGKKFLNLYYVQKHENSVCKKKSQIALNIYKKMKHGKEAAEEITSLYGNEYASKVEGKNDCLVVKAVSKFGYHCKHCGKGFLNSTYVKKHEDNVCKKKSG